MIIPIRCFTCGKVLADKWNPFVQIVKEERGSGETNINNNIDLEYLDTKNPKQNNDPRRSVRPSFCPPAHPSVRPSFRPCAIPSVRPSALPCVRPAFLPV